MTSDLSEASHPGGRGGGLGRLTSQRASHHLAIHLVPPRQVAHMSHNCFPFLLNKAHHASGWVLGLFARLGIHT